MSARYGARRRPTQADRIRAARAEHERAMYARQREMDAAAREPVALQVCGHCAQVIANGDISDGTDRGERVAAAQVAHLGADAARLVLACDGSECDDFSSSPCGACGETLAGERHGAAILGGAR